MNYRLSTGLIAVGVSLVVGSNALAAPSIALKKQLSVPTVPASIISNISKMGWQHPSTATTTSGLSTFKNVVLQKPVIVDEQECGENMYRMWAVGIDVDATKKTQPTMREDEPRSNWVSHGTRYVFEARNPKSVKWHTDVMHMGIYDGNHPVPTGFFGCKGKDIIVRYSGLSSFHNLYQAYYGPGKISYASVSLSSFTSDAAWKPNLPSLEARTDVRVRVDPTVVTVDGIQQEPGFLYVSRFNTTTTSISGDSRIVTNDAKEGTRAHTVPHYRDLNGITDNTEYLTAHFFRLSDGYGVVEIYHAYENEAWVYGYKAYRIRNGETKYTQVQSLPFADMSTLLLRDNGLALKNNNQTILVHGLPKDSYTAAGNVVWENDYQAYVRYTVTNVSTDKQQYWEAIVNKK